MQNPIVCLATFIAKEDQEKALYDALTALIEPTRQEKGCLSYELCRSLENPKLFTMIEKFVDQPAFVFHGEQSYLNAFKAQLSDLVQTVDVKIYELC